MAFEIGENPIDRLVLSVDTSDPVRAEELLSGFADAGGVVVKFGLELQSVYDGPEGLSYLAREYGMDWVYDGKIKDIGNTMAAAVANIVAYDNPPVAITMHADTSFNGMRLVQEAAAGIPILGVTLLTDIGPVEAYEDYGAEEDADRVEMLDMSVEEVGREVRVREVLKRGRKLGRAGVMGLVASAKELSALMEDPDTAHMLKMIPGTRSEGVAANDQENSLTPQEAIARGADLLVVGRQYLHAENKPAELQRLVDEVARGLELRAA